MTSIINRKVLILNRNWAAVSVATMERAMTLLFSTYANGQPKAKILDFTYSWALNDKGVMAPTLDPVQDFMQYDWADWAKLCPKDDEPGIVVSHGRKFRVPEVILLTRYGKMPQQRVHFSRRTIYRRDNYTCQYCGIRPGSEELSIDHIVPKCQKGPTTWENTCLACVQCNSQKAGCRPEEAFRHLLPKEQQKFWRGPSPMKLLSKPQKPKFSLYKGDRTVIPSSWSQFVSDIYWETELSSDNS